MKPEDRPAPDWVGDVSAGVDAWTKRATLATPATPAGPAGPVESAPAAQGAPRREREGRPRSRWPRAAQPPPDAAAQGPEADPESVARTILLDQLTGRARSRQELSDKLASRDVPPEIAGRLLDRFEEVGLVDDAAFARTWVSQRGSGGGSGKGLARRALSQELRRKGIDDEVAREVLDEVDPAEEEQAARLLVRRKLRSLSRVDDTVATRRLVGMLARKGYGGGVAFAVVRDELARSGRHDAPDGPDGGDEVD